jgi:hypothetical protein
MRQIPSGKAAENERKYPYIVAIAIAGKGLDIGLSRRIMAFHKTRHTQPRHGRSTIPKGGAGEVYYRWCFSDLETAGSFAEQFGGTIHPNMSFKTRRGAADRGKYRQAAGVLAQALVRARGCCQPSKCVNSCPPASILFSAISWVFASKSQVLARTSHAHLFWLSSPRFALRRHSLASMRLSLLSDIAAMMIPKAYLFLSDCRSTAATVGNLSLTICLKSLRASSAGSRATPRASPRRMRTRLAAISASN